MYSELFALDSRFFNGLSYDQTTKSFYAVDYLQSAIVKIPKRTGVEEIMELKDKARYEDLHYVGVAPDGKSLWVTDYMSYSLHQIAMDGEHLQTWGKKDEFEVVNGTPSETRMRYPTRITFDENGNTYILDYIESTVRKIDKDGISSTYKYFEDVKNATYESHMVYCQKNDCIFIQIGKELWKITPEEAHKVELDIEMPRAITSLATDKRGNVYLSTADTIYKANVETKSVSVVVKPHLEADHFIAELYMDQSGILYFTDQVKFYQLG